MTQYQLPVDGHSEPIDLRKIIQTFSEKRYWVVGTCLVCFCLALGYIFFKPQKYKTSLLIEITHNHESSLGTSLMESNQSKQGYEPVSLQMALIRSPFILEGIVKKFQLDKNQPPHKAINQLLANLVVQDLSNTDSLKDSSLLQLSFIGTDSQKIINILNEIALTLQQKDIQRKALMAKQTLDFLYRQLPILQNSLKTSEEKLDTYRSTSKKVDVKLQNQYFLTHLSDIDKQLEVLRLKKLDMNEQYTEYHPFMVAINQKRAELHKQRYEILNQIKQLPKADPIGSNLEHDVEVKKSLYMILLNKIHQQEVISAGIISDIHILSMASFAEKILTPNIFLVSIASLFFGFIFSGIGIFIRLLFNRKITQPAFVQQQCDLDHFIVVPYSPKQGQNDLEFKNKIKKHLNLIALDSFSEFAIHSIKFLIPILKSNAEHTQNNLFSLIGLSPHVGKSFIIANLGILLARSNHKVLLIDADLREGHLHNYFNVKETFGLNHILQEELSTPEVLNKVFQLQNLHFIPRGQMILDSHDLLLKEYFKFLLLELSQEYDYVLVSAPSIVSLMDVFVVANIAGTNFLVIGENNHEIWEINSTIKNLKNMGIKLQGGIFNCFKSGKISKYYQRETNASFTNG